jgi:hypothetical protein
MQFDKNEDIDLVSFSVEIPSELMEGIIEVLLPEANTELDPTFIDPEAEYLGQISSFSQRNLSRMENQLLDMCLSGLEVFTVSSTRDDGLVLLRKGDEMIILTEFNAEVIQEEGMSQLMTIVEDQIARELESMDRSKDGGMYR